MKNDYWNYLIEFYKKMKYPLRPTPQEISIMEDHVAGWMREGAGNTEIRALVLGITMEIVNMKWPTRTQLFVAEISKDMIREFWPQNDNVKRHMVRTDWKKHPFKPHQFDVIIGDGVFNVQRYPDDYRQLACIFSQILKPGGLFITRILTQSEPKEEPQDVITHYVSGKITDYHALRFRFLAAMQPDIYNGVLSNVEIIDAGITKYGISLSELYRTTGYTPPLKDDDTLTPAENPSVHTTYPTPDEFLMVMHDYFRTIKVGYGEHPLAQRCPIYAFRTL